MLRSLNGILFGVEEARGRRGGLALDSSLCVSVSVCFVRKPYVFDRFWRRRTGGARNAVLRNDFEKVGEQ